MKQETTTEGAVNPVKSLASLYAEKKPKKPSLWEQMKEGALSAGGLALSPLATVADIAAKPIELIPGVPDFQPEAVRSMNLLVSGGRALQAVTGDTTNLGKYVLTGKEKYWQQMPAVKANEAAGGGFLGALAAAGPYLELGGYAAPIAGSALREAGVLAPKVVPYKPMTTNDLAKSQMRSATIIPDNPPIESIDDLLSYVRRARTMGTTAKKMPVEFQSLSDYFGPNFPQYQTALREGPIDQFIAANVQKIRRLFENSYPLDRPAILYRGIKDDNYLPRQQYANFIKNLKVGDVIEEPGFMSTTVDFDMAQGFSKDGIVFQIEAPQGTRVISPLMGDDLMRPYADPERELLLAPNTKLEITGIDDNIISARIVPSDTPSTTYRTTRAALAEDMAVAKNQPFPIVDDVVKQVNPSVAEGSFLVRNSAINTKQRLTYSVIGSGDNAVVIVDADPLRQIVQAGDSAVDSIVQHLNNKYPNLRIATNDPSLQQALNARQAEPVLKALSEPIRKALTFKPIPPAANESADAFSRRLSQGDQTFDRVTFSQPYAPRGVSVFVHRTLPDQAEALLANGMEAEPASWLGNMGAKAFGEGVFPEGTMFASKFGSPTDEAFAAAMNDQFGDVRGGVPLQVTLPRDARVLEISADLPEIGLRDFTNAGLSFQEYYDFLDVVDAIGGNLANETKVKGALAQIAQRQGYDAVLFGEELMVIPRPKYPQWLNTFYNDLMPPQS